MEGRGLPGWSRVTVEDILQNLHVYQSPNSIGPNLTIILAANSRREAYSVQQLRNLFRYQYRRRATVQRHALTCSNLGHADGCTACSSCHWCRQKTPDAESKKAHCSNAHCRLAFCANCLWNRFAWNLEELNGVAWECPVCLKICNCSVVGCLRSQNGWTQTGQLVGEARKMGFPSAAHYLIIRLLDPLFEDAPCQGVATYQRRKPREANPIPASGPPEPARTCRRQADAIKESAGFVKQASLGATFGLRKVVGDFALEDLGGSFLDEDLKDIARQPGRPEGQRVFLNNRNKDALPPIQAVYRPVETFSSLPSSAGAPNTTWGQPVGRHVFQMGLTLGNQATALLGNKSQLHKEDPCPRGQPSSAALETDDDYGPHQGLMHVGSGALRALKRRAAGFDMYPHSKLAKSFHPGFVSSHNAAIQQKDREVLEDVILPMPVPAPSTDKCRDDEVVPEEVAQLPPEAIPGDSSLDESDLKAQNPQQGAPRESSETRFASQQGEEAPYLSAFATQVRFAAGKVQEGQQESLNHIEEIVSHLHATIVSPFHVSEYDESLRDQTSASGDQRLEAELSTLAGLQNVTEVLLLASQVWQAERYQELTRLLFNKVPFVDFQRCDAYARHHMLKCATYLFGVVKQRDIPYTDRQVVLHEILQGIYKYLDILKREYDALICFISENQSPSSKSTAQDFGPFKWDAGTVAPDLELFRFRDILESDEQLIIQAVSWISEQCQNSALEPGGPVFILGTQLDSLEGTSPNSWLAPQESTAGPLSFLDLACKPSQAMVATALTLLHCSLKGLRDARPPLGDEEAKADLLDNMRAASSLVKKWVPTLQDIVCAAIPERRANKGPLMITDPPIAVPGHGVPYLAEACASLCSSSSSSRSTNETPWNQLLVIACSPHRPVDFWRDAPLKLRSVAIQFILTSVKVYPSILADPNARKDVMAIWLRSIVCNTKWPRVSQALTKELLRNSHARGLFRSPETVEVHAEKWADDCDGLDRALLVMEVVTGIVEKRLASEVAMDELVEHMFKDLPLLWKKQHMPLQCFPANVLLQLVRSCAPALPRVQRQTLLIHVTGELLKLAAEPIAQLLTVDADVPLGEAPLGWHRQRLQGAPGSQTSLLALLSGLVTTICEGFFAFEGFQSNFSFEDFQRKWRDAINLVVKECIYTLPGSAEGDNADPSPRESVAYDAVAESFAVALSLQSDLRWQNCVIERCLHPTVGLLGDTLVQCSRTSASDRQGVNAARMLTSLLRDVRLQHACTSVFTLIGTQLLEGLTPTGWGTAWSSSPQIAVGTRHSVLQLLASLTSTQGAHLLKHFEAEPLRELPLNQVPVTGTIQSCTWSWHDFFSLAIDAAICNIAVFAIPADLDVVSTRKADMIQDMRKAVRTFKGKFPGMAPGHQQTPRTFSGTSMGAAKGFQGADAPLRTSLAALNFLVAVASVQPGFFLPGKVASPQTSAPKCFQDRLRVLQELLLSCQQLTKDLWPMYRRLLMSIDEAIPHTRPPLGKYSDVYSVDMEVVPLKDIHRLRNGSVNKRIVASIRKSVPQKNNHLVLLLTDGTKTVNLVLDQDPGLPANREGCWITALGLEYRTTEKTNVCLVSKRGSPIFLVQQPNELLDTHQQTRDPERTVSAAHGMLPSQAPCLPGNGSAPLAQHTGPPQNETPFLRGSLPSPSQAFSSNGSLGASQLVPTGNMPASPAQETATQASSVQQTQTSAASTDQARLEGWHGPSTSAFLTGVMHSRATATPTALAGGLCGFASESYVKMLATQVQEITGSTLSKCLEAVSRAKQRKAVLPREIPEDARVKNEAVQYILEQLQSQGSP
eukprot:jgi/Botrbrau1/13422/Bobra.0082s0027.2